MIRVGVVGATGYTAVELIKILLRHPEVTIVLATSRNAEGRRLAQEHGQLRDRIDLPLENLSPAEIAARVDCAFCCLPHAASAPVVAELLDANVKVIDLSADYRLNDLQVYEQWYNVKHADPARFGTAAYGLPELFRGDIVGSDLVANPGCFPTSAILALAPLLQNKLIATDGIIVDSKTGVSGAGRKPKQPFHYPECNESVTAYNLGQHRHTPEINEVLSRVAGTNIEVTFSPHLVPMNRGILSTCYATATTDQNEAELLQIFADFYKDAPLVRVSSTLPTTGDSANTSYSDLAVRKVGDRIIVVSCIDNLLKGASGAAVQNFNLMHGFAETTALID